MNSYPWFLPFASMGFFILTVALVLLAMWGQKKAQKFDSPIFDAVGFVLFLAWFFAFGASFFYFGASFLMAFACIFSRCST